MKPFIVALLVTMPLVSHAKFKWLDDMLGNKADNVADDTAAKSGGRLADDVAPLGDEYGSKVDNADGWEWHSNKGDEDQFADEWTSTTDETTSFDDDYVPANGKGDSYVDDHAKDSEQRMLNIVDSDNVQNQLAPDNTDDFVKIYENPKFSGD